MADKAFLFDTSRCTGCHACQVACKCWNNLPSPIGLNENVWSGSHQNPIDINGTTRLIMTYNEQAGGTKGVKWAFGRRSCQHCTDAGCVEVCPAGAVYKDPDTGLVTHNADACIGCHYCAMACPYDVPRYDGPKGVINKCYGCVDRVAMGMNPACVTTCQPEALFFGDRDEVLEEAEVRLANLKSWGYEDAVIYGENEMGGLHVVQVLKYGIEAHGQVENPSYTSAVQVNQILKPVTGGIFALCIAGFGFMNLLAKGYKRDSLVYNAETEHTLSRITGEVVQVGDPYDDRTVVEALFENLPIENPFDKTFQNMSDEELQAAIEHAQAIVAEEFSADDLVAVADECEEVEGGSDES